MRYLLALLVLVLGLEGVDRALLERAMESMTPPPLPDLMHPPAIPTLPPPPPPAPVKGDGDFFP